MSYLGGRDHQTNIVAEKSSAKIADVMGLMPLVAPFIAEQAKKLERAQEKDDELQA